MSREFDEIEEQAWKVKDALDTTVAKWIRSWIVEEDEKNHITQFVPAFGRIVFTIRELISLTKGNKLSLCQSVRRIKENELEPRGFHVLKMYGNADGDEPTWWISWTYGRAS